MTNDLSALLLVLALGACTQRFEGSTAPPQVYLAALGVQGEAQSPASGAKASCWIAPDQGELPPAPELTPEERERLLQGTKIKDPRYIDENPPSPPGLPLTPVPETEVAPVPQGDEMPSQGAPPCRTQHSP